MQAQNDPLLFSRTDLSDVQKKEMFLASLQDARSDVKNGKSISYENMKAEFAISDSQEPFFAQAS